MTCKKGREAMTTSWEKEKGKKGKIRVKAKTPTKVKIFSN